jgi:putative hydrolase of HD superfamily
MEKEQKLLAFLGEAEKLKSTLRHNWMRSGRQEDSAQHSWRAALFFMIAQDLYQFDVDPYKTLAMLVMHDLPEVTNGDIAAFVKDSDPDAHARHKQREHEAAKELYAKLPEPAREKMLKLYEEYEDNTSLEARLAHALEKIESQLQHQESGPKYWGEEERGEHMLHYPDKALAELDDPRVTAIWTLVYDKIYALTYPDKSKPKT